MLVLGLGSNLGDRLNNLRKALHAIKAIPEIKIQQISPVYISDALLPQYAPASWDKPYLNFAIRFETKLIPHDLLQQLKIIETALGRKQQAERWSPRVIDIDILAWDTLVLDDVTLKIPHPSLYERPFALWPLADVAPLWIAPLQEKTAEGLAKHWGSRFGGEAPFHTQQIAQRVDMPQLVGIINVTPDSFSDGGKFSVPEKAEKLATELVAAGAEVIDIGAESTAPHVKELDPQTEWQRLGPSLLAIKEAIPSCLISPKISIDTRHVDVARRALDVGIDWLNDVTGLTNPAMRELVAHSQIDCVVMHHLTIPASREHILSHNQDPVELVYQWGEKQLSLLERENISRERIIFDVGIGFGKVAEQSLWLIKNISAFTKLKTRLLVGHSRKSFLSLFNQYPAHERDIETIVISLYLAAQSVDYLRVHNVDMCARAFKVWGSFRNAIPLKPY